MNLWAIPSYYRVRLTEVSDGKSGQADASRIYRRLSGGRWRC